MTVSDTLPALDIAVRRSASRAELPAPQDAEEDSYALTVTLRDGGHALSRIVTVLNSLCVTELTFRTSKEAPALCEIVVPPRTPPAPGPSCCAASTYWTSRPAGCAAEPRGVTPRTPDHGEDLPGRPG